MYDSTGQLITLVDKYVIKIIKVEIQIELQDDNQQFNHYLQFMITT